MKKEILSLFIAVSGILLGCSKTEELPQTTEIDTLTGWYNGPVENTIVTIREKFTGELISVDTTRESHNMNFSITKKDAKTLVIPLFHFIGDNEVPFNGYDYTIDGVRGLQKIKFTPAEHKVDIYDSTSTTFNEGGGQEPDRIERQMVTHYSGKK